MKKEKGITLVALVITIVVLIILAGVAINLSLGENGIFNKAKEAKRMQLEAEYKEKIGTELLAAQVDAIARNEELEDAQVKDIISNYGELQEDGDTIKIKDSDIEVSLTEIYSGTTTSNGSYTENKAKIAMLEKRAKELQEQLDNLSLSGDEKDKKIAELNSKITELENQKTTLETKIATLEKDKKDLTNNITTLQKETLDGKTTIATAITNKGVETASDASFETMATNIGHIDSGKKVIDLGVGTSFNVSNYEGFGNFTANNFIVEMASGANSSVNCSYVNTGTNTYTAKCTINKTYDKTKGILTSYINNTMYLTNGANGHYDVTQSSGNANVHAYLIY